MDLFTQKLRTKYNQKPNYLFACGLNSNVVEVWKINDGGTQISFFKSIPVPNSVWFIDATKCNFSPLGNPPCELAISNYTDKVTIANINNNEKKIVNFKEGGIICAKWYNEKRGLLVLRNHLSNAIANYSMEQGNEGKRIMKIENSNYQNTEVIVLNESKHLLLGFGSSTNYHFLSVRDLNSGKIIQEFKEHKDIIRGACFLSDNLCASVDRERLLIWDIATGNIVCDVAHHKNSLIKHWRVLPITYTRTLDLLILCKGGSINIYKLKLSNDSVSCELDFVIEYPFGASCYKMEFLDGRDGNGTKLLVLDACLNMFIVDLESKKCIYQGKATWKAESIAVS